MKYQILILVYLLLTLSSCAEHVVVWTIQDIIGLSLVGISVFFFIMLYLVVIISDKIRNYKKKKNGQI